MKLENSKRTESAKKAIETLLLKLGIDYDLEVATTGSAYFKFANIIIRVADHHQVCPEPPRIRQFGFPEMKIPALKKLITTWKETGKIQTARPWECEPFNGNFEAYMVARIALLPK